MIFFIKGYIIDITKWNLKNNKSKVIHDVKFIPEQEVYIFKDYLKTENYSNPNSNIFYKLDDDFLEVIHLKGTIPKSYIYRDNKVIFWSREIDIIKISDRDIVDYLEEVDKLM